MSMSSRRWKESIDREFVKDVLFRRDTEEIILSARVQVEGAAVALIRRKSALKKACALQGKEHAGEGQAAYRYCISLDGKGNGIVQ